MAVNHNLKVLQQIIKMNYLCINSMVAATVTGYFILKTKYAAM